MNTQELVEKIIADLRITPDELGSEEVFVAPSDALGIYCPGVYKKVRQYLHDHRGIINVDEIIKHGLRTRSKKLDPPDLLQNDGVGHATCIICEDITHHFGQMVSRTHS